MMLLSWHCFQAIGLSVMLAFAASPSTLQNVASAAGSFGGVQLAMLGTNQGYRALSSNWAPGRRIRNEPN